MLPDVEDVYFLLADAAYEELAEDLINGLAVAVTNPLPESLAGYTAFAEVVNDGLAVASTLPDEEDVKVRLAEVVNDALAEDLINGPAEVFRTYCWASDQ